MKILSKHFMVLILFLLSTIQLAAQQQNYLTSTGNKLYDVSGKEVRLTGVNWFGFETSLYRPHGVWVRDMTSVLQQIKDLGFNTIRVPWCNEMLNPGASISINSYGTDPYTGISPMNEKEGKVTTPIALMDIFVDWCQENDMKIVLDNHSRAADGFLTEAYWYTPEYSEERWINDWVFMANRYKGKSAVVAMDLNNEPHGSTWGNSNPATDWNKAAERCANAVLAANPDVLIIIEGVGEFEGDSYWWGGQLKGAAKYPIVISDQSKLVYSAHEYGPEVAQQNWFEEANFPMNMPALWDEHFDYLYESNTSPIFVGEFGIKEQDAFGGIAYTWFTTFMDFMGDKYSWTFWSMNPNSGDTGGILQDNWTNVNQWKLDVITPHVAPLIPNVVGGIINPPINNAPIASFIGSNEACGNPNLVTLDASGSSDPDGDALTYVWDFGDGTTSTGVAVTHVYTNITFDIATVTLTVSDGVLSNTLIKQVSLQAGACVEPTINTLQIQSNTVTGVAPLNINFQGVVTMYSGTSSDVNFIWDFGNGTSGFGESASTVFVEEGVYTVTLTADTFGNTVTESVVITVTPPIVVTSDLSINYRDAGNSVTDNSINPHFEIINNGTVAVAYSDLTARYWFTSEDSNDLNYWCDWAQLGTSNVTGSFGQANGMNYLEVSFAAAAGSLAANSNSGNIQNRMAKTNWSNFNEANDYSYDSTKTSFTTHDKVTLYQNETLVWGIEPSLASAKSLSNVNSFIVYPNPAVDFISVSSNNNLSEAIVTIYTLEGKIVIIESSNISNIDVTSLEEGVYVLEVKTSDRTQSKIIVVK